MISFVGPENQKTIANTAIPILGTRQRKKELSLGVMGHTFNLSIWETGADSCELEATLVYISNFLASPGYTARSCHKTTTTKTKELSVISIHEASFCISVWRISVFLEKAR